MDYILDQEKQTKKLVCMPSLDVKGAGMKFYYSKLNNEAMINTINSRVGGNHSKPDKQV